MENSIVKNEKTNTSETQHIYWIDLIRVLAALLVIMIHASYPVLYKFDEVSIFDWMAANFYDSLARVAVPLFFMISGFLLLGKSEPLPDFFWKRFLRVVIPTGVWTVVYLLWSQPAYLSGEMSVIGVIASMLKTIYIDKYFLHLWFMYILIAIYLVVPVLRVFVSAATATDFTYFIILWVISTTGIELVQKVSGFETSHSIPVVSGYVGYFILGFALRNVSLSHRGQAYAFIGIVGSVLATMLGASVLFFRSYQVDGFFYSYFSAFTILMAALIFLLVKNLTISSKMLKAVLRRLGNASFGIYLVHWMVLETLRVTKTGFRLNGWMGPSIYMIPLTVLVVFLISFLITMILKRIPIIRFIVP